MKPSSKNFMVTSTKCFSSIGCIQRPRLLLREETLLSGLIILPYYGRTQLEHSGEAIHSMTQGYSMLWSASPCREQKIATTHYMSHYMSCSHRSAFRSTISRCCSKYATAFLKCDLNCSIVCCLSSSLCTPLSKLWYCCSAIVFCSTPRLLQA